VWRKIDIEKNLGVNIVQGVDAVYILKVKASQILVIRRDRRRWKI